MKTIYAFTNIAPLYRSLLWKLLLNNYKINIHFFFGENLTLGIHSIDFNQKEFAQHKNNLHSIKNIWINKNILVWQKGIITSCIKCKINTAIFLGEMNCLSTWLAAIICRLKGIEVVFWGHGIYGNEGRLKLFIRKTFLRLANKHLLYERRAKELMMNYGFNSDKLYVVFNSLDYNEQKKLREQFQLLTKPEVFPFFKDPMLPTLVFIGRLTANKKLEILIDAVNKMNSNEPEVNLVIIGDGPEQAKLGQKGMIGLTSGWLNFIGACYSEEKIGRYLYFSDLCVSPGNVGLTAIHSLSFGTPVCTHSNFKNQMPEVEAITDNFNGFFFEEKNVDELVSKIENWLANNKDRALIRTRCYEIIDIFYNSNYQLTVFEKLFNDENPEI